MVECRSGLSIAKRSHGPKGYQGGRHFCPGGGGGGEVPPNSWKPCSEARDEEFVFFRIWGTALWSLAKATLVIEAGKQLPDGIPRASNLSSLIHQIASLFTFVRVRQHDDMKEQHSILSSQDSDILSRQWCIRSSTSTSFAETISSSWKSSSGT